MANNRIYTSSRTYDAANRPLTHTFPSGDTTHWAYDTRNLVTSVHYQNKLVVANSYDAGYRLTNQSFANGLNRTINYTRQDNLRTADHVIGKDDLHFSYNYAADKQITAENIVGDVVQNSMFTASYDGGNRLVSHTNNASNPLNQNWNYDDAGNWDSTTKTIGNTTTTENRTHNAADQITNIAGNTATHDAKGNLTAYEINGKQYQVEYDLENRITKVDVDNDEVEYRYDAFGRRTIREEDNVSTALIWWGNSECAEHKHRANQTVIQNDIMEHPSRLNSVIARAINGSKNKLQWYHKNYLDHVYAVSDDSGGLIEHYRYTAFGEVSIYDANGNLETETQIENTIMWNTRRLDAVSGFYLYKYRHYSPELGRWPSRDPLGEVDHEMLKSLTKDIYFTGEKSFNVYSFVENNPLYYIDTYGEGFWDWLNNIFTSVDPGTTGDVVDGGMALGAAAVVATCIQARNALLDCLADTPGECDDEADLVDKLCNAAKKCARAATGNDPED